MATSRMPHPASIGMLALGEATGAKFNLMPYGGGNPTMVAVLNGEVDIGVAADCRRRQARATRCACSASSTTDNKLADRTENAPAINKVFGTKIPILSFVALLGDPHRGDREDPRASGALHETT